MVTFCEKLRNLTLLDRFERMVNIHLRLFFYFSLFTSLLMEITENIRTDGTDGWLVGCFGLDGPLRQYFSLYRAVSQREGERRGT